MKQLENFKKESLVKTGAYKIKNIAIGILAFNEEAYIEDVVKS